MKKYLTLAVTVMTGLVLTACGNTTDKEPEGNANEPQSTEDTSVALLIANLGDLSFNDSAARGLDRAKEELGVNTKIVEYGSDIDKYEASVVDTAEEGYDMVIGSSTLQEYIEEYADDYPETTFVLFDAEADYSKGLENVYSILYKANEAALLGGYVAAKTSETNTIGFLGGMDQPVINDFLLGYIQGAQLADENVKVATTYVGSYTDSSKGKELSFAMFNQGADAVFNVAGGSGVGLIEAAVEQNKHVIGVDSDQAEMYKEKGNDKFADVIPTSVLKNVDYSLFRAIDLYVKGELPVGKTDHLGIKEGGVGLAENDFYKDMVDEATRVEVDELMEKISKGELKVESAYGKSTEEISKARDAVKP